MQDDIISTLLRAALEETGAERGLVIISLGGELRVAAEVTRRHKSIVVAVRDQVVSESLLPASVLYHVLRTRQSVVIDKATAPSTPAADDCVRQHEPGSILCLPLINQTKLVGALLLESYLASGVFTGARITVLKLMSSLAASAIENSRLSGELQEREAKIRRLVDANIIGIYIVDLGGAILESNDAYLRMLGYERADLVSGRLRWTDLTPPEWHAADKLRVEKVKRVGRLPPFEKEFFRKDGTRIPVLMGVARFRQPRNQAVVFAHDMSKQKQAAAMALEARTIEDMRISRRQHDVLLQNFQAMMFRFQAARNLITRHPDEAMRSLDAAINDGEQALDDSRNAIQDRTN